MDSETFWNLGWYDLNLWIEKILQDREKRNQDRELSMEMTRQLICTIINMSGKVARSDKNPTDIWKLSYDKVPEKVKLEPEELEEKLSKFPKNLKNGK